MITGNMKRFIEGGSSKFLPETQKKVSLEVVRGEIRSYRPIRIGTREFKFTVSSSANLEEVQKDLKRNDDICVVVLEETRIGKNKKSVRLKAFYER